MALNKRQPLSYFQDLVGKKIGELTVLGIVPEEPETGKRRVIKYKCQCSCGNICIKTRAALQSKGHHNCGCLKKVIAQREMEAREKDFDDLVGQKIGRLTVIKRLPREKDKDGFYLRDQNNRVLPIMYLCHCDCGNDIKIVRSSLKHHDVRSCGCLHREFLKRGRNVLLKAVCSHQKQVCQCNQTCCCWDCPPEIWEKCPNHCPKNPAKCAEYRD